MDSLLPMRAFSDPIRCRSVAFRASMVAALAASGLVPGLGCGEGDGQAEGVVAALVRPGAPRGRARRTEPAPGAVREKGGPSLALYRYRPLGPERLARGAAAARGDRVQLVVRSGGASHGLVYSVDGAGRVTLHFPGHPEASTAFDRGGWWPLSHSFELDGAPRFERFVLLVSDRPLPVARLLEDAARAGARPGALPPLPPGASLGDTLLLQKE